MYVLNSTAVTLSIRLAIDILCIEVKSALKVDFMGPRKIQNSCSGFITHLAN
jgi:hypothetical protein